MCCFLLLSNTRRFANDGIVASNREEESSSFLIKLANYRQSVVFTNRNRNVASILSGTPTLRERKREREREGRG